MASLRADSACTCNAHTQPYQFVPVLPARLFEKVNALMSVCDNPLSGLATELGNKACDVVRSCVAGALTAIKEGVEVASEVFESV